MAHSGAHFGSIFCVLVCSGPGGPAGFSSQPGFLRVPAGEPFSGSWFGVSYGQGFVLGYGLRSGPYSGRHSSLIFILLRVALWVWFQAELPAGSVRVPADGQGFGSGSWLGSGQNPCLSSGYGSGQGDTPGRGLGRILHVALLGFRVSCRHFTIVIG